MNTAARLIDVGNRRTRANDTGALDRACARVMQIEAPFEPARMSLGRGG
jgi:hypothetical protein